MKKDLSNTGKISLALSFCIFIVGLLYMYFKMDDRTKLNAQDTQFLTGVVIFLIIFLIIYYGRTYKVKCPRHTVSNNCCNRLECIYDYFPG